MANPDLVRYVERSLERGRGYEEIQQALRINGWKPQDIEQALRLATRPSPAVMVATFSQQSHQAMLGWLFRVGFAGVFLVNSLVAVVDPGGFIKLMQGSLMRIFIHDFTPLVWLIAANDLVLGLLILSGRWQNYVLAWSGLWLLAVTLIKISSLLA
ncbi:MAG: hypothetical protein N2318_11710 [Meiothermus sp.]|nr:hypothetical protein [Meiothermus sp.]